MYQKHMEGGLMHNVVFALILFTHTHTHTHIKTQQKLRPGD